MCVLWPDLIQLGEIEPNILFYWEQKNIIGKHLAKYIYQGVRWSQCAILTTFLQLSSKCKYWCEKSVSHILGQILIQIGWVIYGTRIIWNKSPEGVPNCLRAQPEGNLGHLKGIYFKLSECHTLRTQFGFNHFIYYWTTEFNPELPEFISSQRYLIPNTVVTKWTQAI